MLEEETMPMIRIGLTGKEFLELKLSISKFGFWKDITSSNWEALQN